MSFNVGFQRWEHLLFVHWEVAPELIQPRLPDPLQVDTFEGRAFVSVLPFNIPESRPLLVPPGVARLLPESSFVELNFRTYVKGPDDERAIWFFSLDASSAAAVAGAQLVYRLPYFRASMHHSVAGGKIEFSSIRRRGREARCSASYIPTGPDSEASQGSLDQFLVERYVLFAGSTRRLLRARVQHQPYRLRNVEVTRFEENLLELEGIPSRSMLPLSHYAREVDVEISAPGLVRRTRT